MILWQATAILYGAHHHNCGPVESVHRFGDHTKRILRTLGVRDRELNAEYPDAQLQADIDHAKKDPAWYERECTQALAKICANN